MAGRLPRGLVLWGLIGAVPAGCGFDLDAVQRPCSGAAPCPVGQMCSPGGHCVAPGGDGPSGEAAAEAGGSDAAGDASGDGPICMPQSLTPTLPLPPDLLLVIDASGSMSQALGAGSRWTELSGALSLTLPRFDRQAGFGALFFSSDGMCGVAAAPEVPVAPANGAVIASAVANRAPSGMTPTRAAIASGSAYLATLADSARRSLLLATDGAPNCGAAGDDLPATLQAIVDAAALGIPTLVLGIAPDATTDSALNQMAQAGLGPRPGGPPYYYGMLDASSGAQSLEAMLRTTLSCSLGLPGPAPLPDLITLTAGSQTVPRDPGHLEGWDVSGDGASLALYGSWCGMLQEGTLGPLHVVYACP